MGRWLKKVQESALALTDKTDKCTSVSFVSDSPGDFYDKAQLFDRAQSGTEGVVEHHSQPDTNTEPQLQSARDLFELALLPEDRIFIDNILQHIPLNERHNCLTAYRSVWQNAADEETVSFRKQNAGRFAANSWLRQQLH